MMIKVAIVLSLLSSIVSFDTSNQLFLLYKDRIESMTKLTKTKSCSDQVTNSLNKYVKGLLTESSHPFENVLLASQCKSDVTLFPPLVSKHSSIILL
jgi:hypothetical protein